MGASNWTLLRDQTLARTRGDLLEVEKLQAAIDAHRAGCAHTENTEKRGLCVWCDAPMSLKLGAPRLRPVAKGKAA